MGPRFQEPETEPKLAATVEGALKLAEEHELAHVAFPAMGCGFYGIPLDVSARVMFTAFQRHLARSTPLKQITICVIDNREFKPFAIQLAAMA